MDNPEKLASLGTLNTGRKQTKGQSTMDNPEKLASLGTLNTGRKQTKGQSTGQSRETGIIGFTDENKQRGSQEWTIQRNWHHWVH